VPFPRGQGEFEFLFYFSNFGCFLFFSRRVWLKSSSLVSVIEMRDERVPDSSNFRFNFGVGLEFNFSCEDQREYDSSQT
jgi:hypothetical protein